MNPKISDFGLARIFGVSQTKANTKGVVGTYGCLSPEYAMQGLFSKKLDVYSFAVLLLEIIYGRKNSGYIQHNTVNLIGRIWELWRAERALDIVDSSVGYSYEVLSGTICDFHLTWNCIFSKEKRLSGLNSKASVNQNLHALAKSISSACRHQQMLANTRIFSLSAASVAVLLASP
ncbi:putative cysteine-rich receptor-like protein kinase 35 [Olea europaea var. sylvestris]|uniref:putative cysteine-rich receptor-like protein kinase 35 n=1 Tax=Olea europaea var. sylvestris TaxID=158386 RepID=UPI000C1CE2B3|nr:putative cysteine-rich receptor-like protein kinase 35 [Olea europaea var. sylvestris]